MSYTTIYATPEIGEMYEVADFKNAFRSAFLVWDQLSEKYLGSGVAPRMGSLEKMQEVWDIAKRRDIPVHHRIVMMMTFDKVVVKAKNFNRLIKAIGDYAAEFDPGTLLDQAGKIKELQNDESVYAICWNQTSVSYPFWCVGDARMYDLSRDSGHWFLFDELEMC